jgi:voltage-gated potassium channel
MIRAASRALCTLDAGQAIACQQRYRGLPSPLHPASMTTRHQLRRRFLVRRGVIYSLIISMLILLGGGFGFWLLDPHVHTLADGLWLAFTTAATVGYGDMVPSTHASRAFAVIVVLLGLAVLSLVTASVAALFVEKDVHTEERAIERELMQEIRAVRAEVAALRRELGR